jgi:hypothetical protein
MVFAALQQVWRWLGVHTWRNFGYDLRHIIQGFIQ